MEHLSYDQLIVEGEQENTLSAYSPKQDSAERIFRLLQFLLANYPQYYSLQGPPV